MRIDKTILYDYADACAVVQETEEQLRRMRKKRVVQGSVRGSSHDFPYTMQNFHYEGTVDEDMSERERRLTEGLLKKRKANAARVKTDVERFLNTIPFRMQRIIRYKIFEGLTWEEVALKLGGKATGESIRKEFQRYMKEI